MIMIGIVIINDNNNNRCDMSLIWLLVVKSEVNSSPTRSHVFYLYFKKYYLNN